MRKKPIFPCQVTDRAIEAPQCRRRFTRAGADATPRCSQQGNLQNKGSEEEARQIIIGPSKNLLTHIFSVVSQQQRWVDGLGAEPDGVGSSFNFRNRSICHYKMHV